jgi:glutathione synthase/RimK-type ligase-like ATP-grasp enzyme
MEPHIAFLTMADMDGYISDDELAANVLRQRGAWVTTLPWDSEMDWREFDLVILRTTWDYQARLEAFLDVLEQIEASGARLYNGVAVARWNARKSYLRDLAAAGAAIVPTIYGEQLCTAAQVLESFERFGADEMVLKPLVGASAIDAFRLRREEVVQRWEALQAAFGARPFLSQPLIPNVLSEGEFSLIYLDGRFSHAVLKCPKAGDFRSQEEYGGQITAVVAETGLRAAGDTAMALAGEGLLYGRVDLVRGDDGRFLLMELELIEPALYLRMDTQAPARFAEAILRRVAAA